MIESGLDRWLREHRFYVYFPQTLPHCVIRTVSNPLAIEQPKLTSSTSGSGMGKTQRSEASPP